MLLDEHGHDAVAALVPRQSKLPSAQVRHREHSSPTNLELPADWIVGFDSRSLLPESRLSLAQRLDPMLRTAVTAAIIMYNRQGQAMSIESVEEQGVPLTTVQGLALFGKGSTATFASQNGYFWAGTSRGIVRDMARIVPADSLATAAHFRALANPRLEDRSHLAYLDLEALRSLVARTASDASASSTGGASAPQDAPGRAGISPTLSDLLGLADRMLVEIGIDGSGIRIAATVATSAGQ